MADASGAAFGHRSYSAHSGWSDSSARDLLQLMTESVAAMVGFEVVALSVALDGQLVTMAYTGPDEFREHMFQPDPVEVLDPVLKQAESWGRFRFLAAEHHDGEFDGHWLVVATNGPDHPDAWHPLDVLLAVLSDDAGNLIGVLSVDAPLTGLRPAAAQRSLLERYAAQAERALVTAFEREAMIRQIAHAQDARRLVRSALRPAQASVEAILSNTHRPLVEGFRASGSWVQVLDSGSPGRGYARGPDGEEIALAGPVIDLARRLAPRLWAGQEALVLGDRVDDAVTAAAAGELLDDARRHLSDLKLSSVLAVALGVGADCLGFLALTRRAEDPVWSAVEVESAQQLGHDLGAAILATQALERERCLVSELREVDDYRSNLIARISHELRTPLTVISVSLELLGELELEDLAVRHQEAMGRGAVRMRTLVDDLLLLAQVSHPHHPLVRVPVDVRRIVDDVVTLVDSTARSKGVTLRVETADDYLVVPGDPAEVDRLLLNLVSNAVKYTPAGGTVSVAAYGSLDSVVLRVADDGLGISAEDQEGLFKVFFRTANPDALREPGTGLGLAIVSHIAERHGGAVRVSSELGRGTTFTVTLPREA